MQHGCSTGIVLALALAGSCAREGPSPLLDSYGWSAPARGLLAPAAAIARVAGVNAGSCEAVGNPWSGAQWCGPRAVMRPGRGQCSVFADISPKIDRAGGFYRAERDRRNWVPVEPGRTLELLAAYVADNGEGDEQLHGPHGNLYWDVFGPFEPLMQSRDGATQRRFGAAHVLRGPHRTHGTTDEWLDDEALTYANAGLFRWGADAGTERAIVLRVWESDGYEDGFLGRRSDVMGMEYIRREDTEKPCGLWVPFHVYTNAHPRVRTSRPALWLLIRTRPVDSFGVLARLAMEPF